mgnify:CR=1 FL=1
MSEDFFFLMIRRPPRSTQSRSSAASDVYKRQVWLLFLTSVGTVQSYQKISDTEGNFTAPLWSSGCFGMSVGAIGDVDNDGVTDIVIGEPFDKEVGNRTGSVFTILMESSGTVTSHQEINLLTVTFPYGSDIHLLQDMDAYGRAVASPGDLDNDGVADLAVGAPSDDSHARDEGCVYVQLLNADGSVKSLHRITEGSGGFTGLIGAGAQFGISVSAAGDVDDDGVEDILVGETNDSDGGGARGAVWVLLMNTDGTVKANQKISDTQGNFAGILDNNDNFGVAVSNIGDLDNDGVEDIAVGAHGDDDGGAERGAVWILFLTINGTVKDFQKISNTQGGFTLSLIHISEPTRPY